MLSHFSKALFTLLLTVLFAFVWALFLFYTHPSLRPDSVDWAYVLRDLFLCLAAFLLFVVAAYLPVRQPVALKLTLGFGLHFLGVWQNLLNDLIQPDGWLPQTIGLALVPLGLLIATLGLYQMGRAYRVSRLMLGSYQKIERDLATIDQLTQLYNRRYFFTTCGPMMDHPVQENDQPVVIGFRVLNLTELNQRLGLQAGDEVLIRVGKAVRRYLRPGQIAARMGGRRFAVFMPDASLAEAERFAEQLAGRLKHVLLKDQEGEETLATLELSFQIAAAEPGETLESLSRRTGSPVEENEAPRGL
ncbi:GGDEF domain-containing protein [Marinimicrobium agarilyticum]|uniref:GGDEF domain-containing protein n=1 Tax=Marinimicrobium agarilyticum TaxID=306546 RepID=UPI0003F5B457|nr:GGDEF domain-containing protein [Marinimicrobium agarilyticum]